MTFSYTAPQYSDRDHVRFLCRDTTEASAKLDDEEYEHLLTEHGGDVYGAAAQACRNIALDFGAKADKKVGGLSLSWKNASDRYEKLADSIEAEASKLQPPIAYASGISHDDIDTVRSDTDRVESEFHIGEMDNRSVGRTAQTAPEYPREIHR